MTLASARGRRGCAVLITGLPAAGKTSLGRALAAAIEERHGRAVTLLDGDEMRRLLSSELGFTREHRRLNVLRHGFLAAEIARHGGLAVCTLIAPYAEDRAEMRKMVQAHGLFVEVHLATPLEVCERRDPKGLYARARRGELHHMTGIDDPYEPPSRPELALDGAACAVAELADRVLAYLAARGVLDREA